MNTLVRRRSWKRWLWFAALPLVLLILAGVMFVGLRSPQAGLRTSLTRVLVSIGEPAVPILVQVAKDPHAEVSARTGAIMALGEVGGERAIACLVEALRDPSLREAAVQALIRVGRPAVPALLAALDDSTNRQPAVDALVGIAASDPDGVDLAGTDLSGCDLSGRQLSRMRLSGANLNDAQLEGADLSGADMRGASLRGANLAQARLEWADLSGADLTGANLAGSGVTAAQLASAGALRQVNLQGNDLWKASLPGIDLTEANLSGVRAAEADLSSAVLTGAVFAGADLRQANLSGARLEGADLSEARLDGANLKDARMSGANLHRATMTGARLDGARLEGANLNAADLSSASLRGAQLDQANMRGALLVGADLQSADLTQASLTGTVLSRANLKGCILTARQLADARDMSGVDLSGQSFPGAVLRHLNLPGANFSRVNLRQADLSGTNLSGADFSHADLSYANLVGADITGANLTGAILDRATLWDVVGGSESLWDQASSIVGAYLNRPHEIADTVRSVCSGEGVPATRRYSGGIGEHPLVVVFEEDTVDQETYFLLVSQITEIGGWNARLRASWTPGAVRFTELVACVRSDPVVIEVCGPYYTPGGGRAPDITRYRVRVTMTVREAATGRVVARRSFYGSEPRTCGMFESYGTTSIWGSNVTFEDVRDWLGSLAYVPPDLPSLERWTAVIEERFTDNRYEWPIGSLWKGEYWSETTGEIADGVYRWHGKARRDAISWVYPEVGDIYDFYLSVDVRQVAGPPDAQGGIIFRLSDDGYYRFSLTAASQMYRLERWYKDEWTTLAEGTSTAAIRREGWNTIQAAVVGAHLTLWVNGELVATAEDFALIKGKAGMTVGFFSPGDEGTFEFDNWILRVPGL